MLAMDDSREQRRPPWSLELVAYRPRAKTVRTCIQTPAANGSNDTSAYLRISPAYERRATTGGGAILQAPLGIPRSA